MEELGTLSNYQCYCTNPKKIKCEKIGITKLPFFKISFHCKSVARNKVVMRVVLSLSQYLYS